MRGIQILQHYGFELLALTALFGLYLYWWFFWRRRIRWKVRPSMLGRSHFFALALLPIFVCAVTVIYIPLKQISLALPPQPSLRAEVIELDRGLEVIGGELVEISGALDRISSQGLPSPEPTVAPGPFGPFFWIFLSVAFVGCLYYLLVQEKLIPLKVRVFAAAAVCVLGVATVLAGCVQKTAEAAGSIYDASQKRMEYERAKANGESPVPLISFRHIPFPDGTMKLDQRTFVIPFEHEGGCSDGDVVVGEPQFQSFLSRLGEVLAMCSDGGIDGSGPSRRAVVRLRGFASTSQVQPKDEEACGASGTAANVQYAKARVAQVKQQLANKCPEDLCEFRPHIWNHEYFDMASELYYDRNGPDFSELKGQLNRRVEVTILDSGDCELPAPM